MGMFLKAQHFNKFIADPTISITAGLINNKKRPIQGGVAKYSV